MPRTRPIAGLIAAGVLSGMTVAALAPGLLVGASSGALDLPGLVPGARHLLGTDGIGQDLLAELVRSTRNSLGVALFSSLIATFVGVTIGLAAGYLRGRWDEWLMRLTDVFMLLPGLPLVILLSAYINSGIIGIALVIGITAWPTTARVVRANVRQLCRQNYIRSAEAMGDGRLSIMFRHILPNILPLIMAKATLAAANAMVAEAGVSFLGLGGPNYRSWGAMLHDAFSGGGLLNGCYWWYLPPVVCISATVLSLTWIGQLLCEQEDVSGDVGAVQAKPCHISGTADGGYLEIADLSVDFISHGGFSRALDNLRLSVSDHERLAIIGQTGSGKSVMLLALMGLLPANARIAGRLVLNGKDLTELSEGAYRKIRGREIAYVPQGTGASLNPLMTVGRQVAEAAQAHGKLSRAKADELAAELLTQAGIKDAARLCRDYPHRFSGGMIQRALVAMGLAAGAPLLLLDEPTKGLDAANRDMLQAMLAAISGKTLVAVTHDLGFAASFADRVVVMLESRIVESGPCADLLSRPLHPYTAALMEAQPARGLKVPVCKSCGDQLTKGCPFAAKCTEAFGQCQNMPPLFQVEARQVRCWLYAA